MGYAWVLRWMIAGALAQAVACSNGPAAVDAGPEIATSPPVTPEGGPSASGDGGSGSAGGAGAPIDLPDAGPVGPVVGVDGGQLGVPEAEPVPSLIGDVAVQPESGTFVDRVLVALTTELPGAEIRYTTDGQLPSADSAVYPGDRITLTATTQLRAQAFFAGQPMGAPTTALYVARTFDVQSDLPLLVVDGYGAGKPMDKEVYLDAAFMVFEPVDGAAALSNPPTLATRAGYHVRGQSSARFDKTPYRVELWDHLSEDADYPLLGMGAEADWALIGPYADRTLIRNAFMYSLGRELGIWSPRLAFVEAYIRYDEGPLSEDDYAGVYTVVETVKNHRHRLDLKQLREHDTDLPAITGGYIFKFDWAAAEEPTLTCTGSAPLSSSFGGPGGGGFGGPGGGFGGPPGGGMGGDDASGTCWDDLEVVDPDPLMPEQAAWLTDCIQAFHDALHEEPIGDYASYVDVASFVDLFIVNELSRDIDAFTRSAFYHKERDQPIKAGPLWDYNFALNSGAESNRQTSGWQYRERTAANDWFTILAGQDEFMARVAARWRELRQGPLSDSAVDARIDMLTAPLANAAQRDMARWPVSSIGTGFISNPTDPTWEGQVEAMRSWIHERASWLDSELIE